MPIGCGDAPVFPGDVIVGDGEGVVVLPAHMADELADEAVEMTAFEDFVTEEVRKGRSILGLYPATDERTAAISPRGGPRTRVIALRLASDESARPVVDPRSGPARGLQSLARTLPTAQKLEWIRDAHAAGPARDRGRLVRAGAAVAAARGHRQLVAYAKTLPGLCASVLVPNLKGARAGHRVRR